MEKYSVTVKYSEEDERFIAEIPGIPSVHGHGDTREAALRELGDSFTLFKEHEPPGRQTGPEDLVPGARVRHLKTGVCYRILNIAEYQSIDPVSDKKTVVVYDTGPGTKWNARSLDEFCDGRFVCV